MRPYAISTQRAPVPKQIETQARGMSVMLDAPRVSSSPRKPKSGIEPQRGSFVVRAGGGGAGARPELLYLPNTSPT